MDARAVRKDGLRENVRTRKPERETRHYWVDDER